MSIMRQLIQEEKLLHLCLYVSSRIADKNDYTRSIADELIFGYIIDEFKKSGKETFTEQEAGERYTKLATDWVLTKHVLDGNIEVDMSGDEMRYKLTDKGHAIVKDMTTDPDALHRP